MEEEKLINRGAEIRGSFTTEVPFKLLWATFLAWLFRKSLTQVNIRVTNNPNPNDK